MIVTAITKFFYTLHALGVKMFLVILLVIIVTHYFITDISYPYYRNHNNDGDGLSRVAPIPTYKIKYVHSNRLLHCKVFTISKVSWAEYTCLLTKTFPRVTVCVFSEWMDKYISHDIIYTGVWEPKVLHDIQKFLLRNPDSGFIDLGAHIGYYSLIAAKMGHKVIAVEPLMSSVSRINKAVKMERLESKIIILHNAVGDRRGESEIILNGDNQGDTRVKKSSTPCTGSCPEKVEMILLDDLLEVVTFPSCIIKMDVQGYEYETIINSELFFSKINVLYIFMEWGLVSKFHHLNSTNQLLDKLFSHHFRPFSLTADGAKALNPKECNIWPFDIVWQKMLYVDEIETVYSNHFYFWP